MKEYYKEKIYLAKNNLYLVKEGIAVYLREKYPFNETALDIENLINNLWGYIKVVKNLQEEIFDYEERYREYCEKEEKEGK